MKTGSSFGRLALGLVLCLTPALAACSTAWIGEAEQIVAALIPAAANIVALVAALQGKGVSAADLQTIQSAGAQAGADLQLLQSLITAYENADATAKPGILSQIQAALEAVQASLQGLLPALHIQDAATQTKITAVVGLVISEVQSLAEIVPLVSGNAGTSAPAPKRAARTGSAKAPLSANEFVSSFNATLTAKTGNTALDKATAGLKIRLHPKIARWATLGALK